MSFKGKSVLITGACGTVGSELVRQVVEAEASRVVCLDNNETNLFYFSEAYSDNPAVEWHLADIRNRDALSLRMRGADIVLHAAALKHVGLCEDAPNEAVATNIDGVQNIINAATDNDVERVIFTSSDKAVNPTNVMGTSKLMGERLMTAASQAKSHKRTIFASTRFGNVLGSNGSVIPLFRRQIERGGPITLTHPDMTRFIMSISEAVALVIRSVWLARGGEVFVTKMPVARISDLAEVMRESFADGRNIEIKEIGVKPGEKLYEELMNEEEVRRSYELDDFFVILPALIVDPSSSFPYVSELPKLEIPYNSKFEESLSQEDLKIFLGNRGLLAHTTSDA